MRRMIYKTKRFIHSLKVRWKLRKSFKIWREASFHFQMAAYDMAQTLKGIRPMSGDNLDRMANVTGTQRQEGETDVELRKRLTEIVKQRGAAPWKKE